MRKIHKFNHTDTTNEMLGEWGEWKPLHWSKRIFGVKDNFGNKLRGKNVYYRRKPIGLYFVEGYIEYSYEYKDKKKVFLHKLRRA